MIRFSNILKESNSDTYQLYHGGSGLEYSYKDTMSHSGGRWEHGPGLYLTNYWETANKYSKGSRKLYLVTIKKGIEDKDVRIPIEKIKEFVNDVVIKSKRKEVLSACDRVMLRMKNDDIHGDTLINIIINEDAISNTNTSKFQDFLIDCGIDCHIERSFGGRDEIVVVVINPKIIIKVEVIKNSDIPNNYAFELDVNGL